MFQSDSRKPHERRSRISAQLFPRRRRGMSTAWLLIFGPVFLIMLYFAVELGNLHIALTELENGLEAAALAGAKEFANGGTPATARDYTLDYAEANTVAGAPLTLADNETPSAPSNPNGNAACDTQIVEDVDVILGSITGTTNAYVFCADDEPGAGEAFGVRTQKRLEVTPLCNKLLGVPMGPFYISAQVTARCEAAGNPHLVRVTDFDCDCNP
jgi:Flp pilus assembly protein TadG